MKKWGLWSVIFVLLLGCSLPFNLANILNTEKREEVTATATFTVETGQELIMTPTTAAASGSEQEFQKLIKDGDLAIEVKGNGMDLGFTGRSMQLTIRNESGEPVDFVVPCGLTFIPRNPSDQQMMVIQSIDVELGPGETEKMTPYVVCVESSRDAPSTDSSYTVGEFATDPLLAFSDCLCKESFDENTDFTTKLGIQFAAWSVADQQNTTEIPENFSDILGGEINIPGLSDYMKDLSKLIIPESQKWLEKCGIVIPEK